MLDTVLFDMGGTLEDIRNTEETRARTAEAIVRVLGEHGIDTGLAPETLWALIWPNIKRCKDKCELTRIEMKPEEIWTAAFAELNIDCAAIAPFAEELAHMWEVTYYERALRPRVKETLAGLSELGLKLGVVSNTASLYQVFDSLEEYGIRGFFRDVTLSCVVGYRKPDPNIFRVALRQLRSDAAGSVYVGDTLSRDVAGPRACGFAKTIQIHSFLTDLKDTDCVGRIRADHNISDISEVLQIMRAELCK